MKFVIWLLLTAASVAQVPQGVTGSMYEPTAPELMAYVNWQPVPSATSYNVYKEVAGSTCPTASWKLDANVTTPYYLDDPNPSWYNIPVTGDWRAREWCYAVTAIVNGIESGLSKAVFVAIGNSGYLNLQYRNVCTGPAIVPFPYMGNTVSAHFYYVDSASVQHEFAAIHLYNAYPYPAGDPLHSYNEEWEWKLPTIGLDGTVIPWDQNGIYLYEMETPDGGYSHFWFTPQFQLDASWYNQVSLNRIPNAAYNDWCPIYEGPGGNYAYWQNVTR